MKKGKRGEGTELISDQEAVVAYYVCRGRLVSDCSQMLR